MAQTAQSTDLTFTQTRSFRYLLHLPPGYEVAGGKKWPLILFLHGMGERGDDLDLVKTQGLPKKLESWPDCPFIVVSPQCPMSSFWTWEADALNALLDDVMARYVVDPERVYLTGLSMGGAGTWQLAIRHPERFAALAPICAPSIPVLLERVQHLPIWVFHGAKDTVVPVETSDNMVKVFRSLGGDIQYTVYLDAGHDSWTQAYDNPALYEWMAKQKVMSKK
jgi:predicted peptidase